MTVVHRIFCEHCGEVTHTEVRRCPSCGRRPMANTRMASCPTCGRGFRENENFCSGCGRSLREFKQVKPLYCRQCGFMLGVGANYCCECGCAVEAMGAGGSFDDPSTTLYGMPRIEDRRVVIYGSPSAMEAVPVYGTPGRRGFLRRFLK